MTNKTANPLTTIKSLLGTPNKPSLYRHGDVMIAQVTELPQPAKERAGTILARGEFTGHSHRIAEAGSVQLWEAGNETFLEVRSESATLVHEEHKPIVLARGLYRFWMQREYTPQAIVRVVD